MIPVLALHAVVGVGILLAAPALRRTSSLLAMVPPVAALAFAGTIAGDVIDGDTWTTTLSWVPGLGLDLDLFVDGLGLVMVLLVAGIGLAVAAYSGSYFGPNATSARTAGLLVLFAGAMLGLVTAEHVVVLYVFWELTSILSWLLIGQRHTDAQARAAATQALVVTAAGGLALLGGLVILAREAGTWSLVELLADPPRGAVAGTGVALVLLGVFTKSAQYPFHAWLPGAMVAPTPVSAYLHSATMVKAGVYLVARFAPAYGDLDAWQPVILAVGLTTMIAGGLRAIRQDDLKLLLAMGTVSQLGFLVVLTGIGFEDATIAGVTLLVAHALFKATLFLVVGIVDHQAHTRDRTELADRRLGAGWTAVRACAVLTAASMAGIPLLAGFIAKEEAYDAFLHHGGAVGSVGIVGIVIGSVLTMAYSLRFAAVFWRRADPDDTAVPAPRTAFAAPVYVLTVLTVAAGLVPAAVIGRLVDRAAAGLLGIDAASKLALWHGLNSALVLSVVTIAAGTLLWRWNEPVVRATARVAPPIDGARGFQIVLEAVFTLARTTTTRVQTGSLPRYVGIILLVVVGGPAALAVATTSPPDLPDPTDVPAQLALACSVVAAAVATALVRRRLGAVVVLGAVGYSMAGIFVAQGAPDLALTQFAVETLTIVAFVLVLRQLPARFHLDDERPGRLRRLLVSAAVGASAFVLVLAVSGESPERPASDMAVERALPEAGGRNVVNVVLVDFRGLDTLGEISVLLVAAVGVTTLARVGRRPPREGARPLPDGDPLDPSTPEYRDKDAIEEIRS
ncbi:MAG TPA: hydrogen gas-evolving membrane-bound hydrogenase subunit E [Acidimicrobiales bacterium]|nr:hydrogen gas-evolving membrane-bound hydrogenase subunit E [Acidimicrobiales bacterium]